MKKLFVTGFSGFLGWHIGMSKQKNWKIVGTYLQQETNFNRHECLKLDITDFKLLKKAIKKSKPDAILHLAAISSPAACEQNVSPAYQVNVVVSTLLAEYAEKRNIPFYFTSTDQVFSGREGRYPEEFPTEAINIYGKQKAEAENRILEVFPKAAIVRLPLLYGLLAPHSNFLSEWLSELQNERRISAFSDEYRSPLSGDDAADGLFLLLDKKVKGTWHLGGPERLSRVDMAEEIVRSFDLSEKLIHSLTHAEAKLSTPRPKDVSLNSSKAFELGYSPNKFKKELKRMRKAL